MNLLQLIVFILVIVCVGKLLGLGKEGWASSPATLIQLSASSGYYPLWQYGYGYRYPYYHYMYGNGYQDGYQDNPQFPKAQGSYKYY